MCHMFGFKETLQPFGPVCFSAAGEHPAVKKISLSRCQTVLTGRSTPDEAVSLSQIELLVP